MGHTGQIYRDSQTVVVRKRSVQCKKRRSRTKQPRSKTVRYFRGEGPAKGLKLSYDPEDPIFPRQWVLSKDDLIIGTYRSEPKELWEKLTADHKAIQSDLFEPIPMERQNMRQIMDKEELNRLNFWERVWSTGRAKHNHPDLDVLDGRTFKGAKVKDGVLHLVPKLD